MSFGLVTTRPAEVAGGRGAEVSTGPLAAPAGVAATIGVVDAGCTGLVDEGASTPVRATVEGIGRSVVLDFGTVEAVLEAPPTLHPYKLSVSTTAADTRETQLSHIDPSVDLRRRDGPSGPVRPIPSLRYRRVRRSHRQRLTRERRGRDLDPFANPARIGWCPDHAQLNFLSSAEHTWGISLSAISPLVLQTLGAAVVGEPVARAMMVAGAGATRGRRSVLVLATVRRLRVRPRTSRW